MQQTIILKKKIWNLDHLPTLTPPPPARARAHTHTHTQSATQESLPHGFMGRKCEWQCHLSDCCPFFDLGSSISLKTSLLLAQWNLEESIFSYYLCMVFNKYTLRISKRNAQKQTPPQVDLPLCPLTERTMPAQGAAFFKVTQVRPIFQWVIEWGLFFSSLKILLLSMKINEGVVLLELYSHLLFMSFHGF